MELVMLILIVLLAISDFVEFIPTDAVSLSDTEETGNEEL